MNLITEQTIGFTKFLSWGVFIIFLLQTAAMVVSYISSLSYPNASYDFYLDLDLSYLYNQSVSHYSVLVLFIVIQMLIKISVVAFIIKMLKDLKIDSPFSFLIARSIEIISYLIISLWVIIWITNFYSAWLVEQNLSLEASSTTLEFILLAGVLFIFAQIFKKGVEIQSENEMTV